MAKLKLFLILDRIKFWKIPLQVKKNLKQAYALSRNTYNTALVKIVWWKSRIYTQMCGPELQSKERPTFWVP